MIDRAWRAMPGLALVLVASACTHAPRDAGFADVQNSIAQSTGAQIRGRGTSAEDQAVDAAVADLLRRPLGADQAVQVALLNNRGLQATYEELGIARAELVQAGLLGNPIFTASTRFPSLGGGPNVEFSVAQDFLGVFLLPLKGRVAAASFEAAKHRVTGSVLDLAADVRRAYYQYQAAQQTVEMRRTIEHATAVSADAARRLHDAGNISDLDLASEQASHEQAKLDLADAEAQATDSRERLNSLLGLWGEQTQWTVPDRLPEVPAGEVPARGLESLAVARRPDLAAAAQEVIVAAQSLGLAQPLAALPQVEVGLDTERESGGGWLTGPNVSLPIPLFDQGQGAVARSQAQLRQARQRYYALAVHIRSQVRSADQRMRSARERANYYQKVVLPLRQRITQQTQLQYNAMQVGIFQLLQARQGEIDAGRAYVEALRDYWLARCDLERAIGGTLPSPTTRPATLPATQPHTLHHGAIP